MVFSRLLGVSVSVSDDTFWDTDEWTWVCLIIPTPATQHQPGDTHLRVQTMTAGVTLIPIDDFSISYVKLPVRSPHYLLLSSLII